MSYKKSCHSAILPSFYNFIFRPAVFKGTPKCSPTGLQSRWYPTFWANPFLFVFFFYSNRTSLQIFYHCIHSLYTCENNLSFFKINIGERFSPWAGEWMDACGGRRNYHLLNIMLLIRDSGSTEIEVNRSQSKPIEEKIQSNQSNQSGKKCKNSIELDCFDQSIRLLR